MNKDLAILLAVYNPREDWLIELLDSLNRQTYPKIHLYVRDDASPKYPFERLEEVVRTHITAFPYTIRRNEKNLGSNQTFATLVGDCHEHYIAFCDQDDVWLPEKLKNTVRYFEESPLSPTLVCTDVRVIDGDGKETQKSITEARKHHVFLRGTGLSGSIVCQNFVIGCTLLMERERALSYLPFPDTMVHDHYLAFRASVDGAIDYLEEPQMLYRIYGGNQTGVMLGVKTKADYKRLRIDDFANRVASLAERVSTPELETAAAWCDARAKNFNREKGGFRALYRMRGVNRATSIFELFALRFPTPLFRFAIRLIQKGVL